MPESLDARLLKTVRLHLLAAMEECEAAQLQSTVGRLAVCCDLIGTLLEQEAGKVEKRGGA